MSHRRFSSPLIVALIAGAASLFPPLSHAAAPEPPAALPPKPALPSITRIELQPASLTLEDGRDDRPFLVWGIAADGRRFDLTDEAKAATNSPAIVVDGERFVSARSAGEGVVTVEAQGHKATLPVKVLSAHQPPVRFIRDVLPVMSKVGCNQGTCHGAAAGKNGFKLSLRGYDPEYDYNALVNELQGRRFNRVKPEESLMLLKAVGAVPHEGRKLFEVGSRHYNIIHNWIKEGVPFEASLAEARASRIEVIPASMTLDLPGRTQHLMVLAHYPDGTVRDVTREAVMSSNDAQIADIAGNRITAVRRGEAAMLVRYEGNYAVSHITVMGDRTGFAWKPMPEHNYVDTHINSKLQQVQILPSDICSDADFLRRIHLDLTGLPPTAEAARAFLNDPAPSRQKREKLIDDLLGSRDFVAYWSNKWADLLQCNSKQLGAQGVWGFREWIRQSVAQNKPYDKFVYELIAAQGSTMTSPAASYFVTLGKDGAKPALDTGKITEDVSQTFLGVRFNCNKCHDHPFERWTQAQYYEFGAYFAQVSFRKGERPDEFVVYHNYNGGEIKHPKYDTVVAPRVPYGSEPSLGEQTLRRDAFARWLTSRDNPLFAKSYANRVWSYFFGRGIIDPVDDIRASNPPVNEALLEALTQRFIDSGFDVQKLIRDIVASRTYQLSIVSNKWNADDKVNFSHAAPRRLTAEQMMDAVALATGTQMKVPGLPTGMRSVYAPDGMVQGSDFLKLFGRPKRETACECERTGNVSLAHALNLINGPLISDAVIAPDNAISRLVAAEKDDKKVIESIYLAVLSRKPTDAEYEAIKLGGDKSRLETAQDLAWALLNSPAFLFNR